MTVPLRPFDMRDWLEPRRLTTVMWDHTFLTRHYGGDSFADYDRVLDEAVERGYNTLRIDPIPQSIDLSAPEKVYKQNDLNCPLLPWTRPQGFEGPAGKWLIEFVEKARKRGLYLALSSWWGGGVQPLNGQHPTNLTEAADCWIRFLEQWKKRLGLDGIVYVDLNNEFPCFLPGMMDKLAKEGGERWSERYNRLFTKEVNDGLARMRGAFPELRYMVSLHSEINYTKLDLTLDCMDIHFYSTMDNRWSERVKFWEYCASFFKNTDWHADFSDRCAKANKATAPMLRAHQRYEVECYSEFARRKGIPLLTTESWSSWYYIDSPKLDWGWLLDWAEWSVEDAIDFQMWGWCPHNYVQPQFQNWKDVSWHRRLTDKFLKS